MILSKTKVILDKVKVILTKTGVILVKAKVILDKNRVRLSKNKVVLDKIKVRLSKNKVLCTQFGREVSPVKPVEASGIAFGAKAPQRVSPDKGGYVQFFSTCGA